MNFDLSFEQRLARVDLRAVMAHVQADTGLSDADIERAEDLYRKFLTLKGMDFNKPVVPPRLVDEVWHAHITFTRQYAADCELLFGEFFHHNPSDDAEDKFNSTVAAYAHHFNVNLLAYGTTAPEWLSAASCE
jgi:hypothetical protein